jgi:hypothetical protein
MFLPQVRFRLWLLDSLYDAHRPVIGGNLSRPLQVFANVRFGPKADKRGRGWIVRFVPKTDFNILPVTLSNSAAINLEGGDNMHKIIAALIAIAGIYLTTFAVAQVPLQTLRTCLEIEDQSKERLDCYDEKLAPEPKQVSAPAKTVQDCRFVKEEDERLTCFNRFVNPPPKKNTTQKKRKSP